MILHELPTSKMLGFDKIEGYEQRGQKINQGAVLPRQNLIRSKKSSISLFPVTNRLNMVREGNQEFLRRVARSLTQHFHI